VALLMAVALQEIEFLINYYWSIFEVSVISNGFLGGSSLYIQTTTGTTVQVLPRLRPSKYFPLCDCPIIRNVSRLIRDMQMQLNE